MTLSAMVWLCPPVTGYDPAAHHPMHPSRLHNFATKVAGCYSKEGSGGNAYM